MTQVNTRMATADHGRQGRLLTDSTNPAATVCEFASGKAMHNQSILISVRNSAHNFSVKFSESVCVASVASLTEQMAARSIVYHAHGTADGDKFCCYPWLVCHDIKSVFSSLRLAPTMINHLTSITPMSLTQRKDHFFHSAE